MTTRADVLQKATVQYNLRVPAEAAVHIENDARKRGISPTQAAVQALLRGITVPPKESRQP